MTRRFLSILIRYTPMVEVYSIDEVFMDVTQEAPRWGGPLTMARRIQAEFRGARGVDHLLHRDRPQQDARQARGRGGQAHRDPLDPP